jgi:hypothetical protein
MFRSGRGPDISREQHDWGEGVPVMVMPGYGLRLKFATHCLRGWQVSLLMDWGCEYDEDS